MQDPQRVDPRFQEQIEVLEGRIAQALFEQVWSRSIGDAERHREAGLRLEVLQLQLTLRRQQRLP